jgi:hypothetical protein
MFRNVRLFIVIMHPLLSHRYSCRPLYFLFGTLLHSYVRIYLFHNIKMNLKSITCSNESLIHLAQDMRCNMAFCEHGDEPSVCIDGTKFLDKLIDY